MNILGQYEAFVVLAPALATAILLLGCYVLYFYRSKQGYLFCALQLILAGWLISNTIELIAPDEEGTLAWAKFTYIFVNFTSVFWMVFAGFYTNKISNFTKPIAALSIIPLITIVLTFTNDSHRLVWSEYSFFRPSHNILAIYVHHGPWFWLMATYNYGLIIGGSVLMIQKNIRSLSLFRKQSILVVCAVILPLIVNFFYIIRLFESWKKDYTPISFAFSLLFLGIAVFRHRMLDLKPIARDMLIDRMTDAMFVLDTMDRIIDVNRAALKLVEKKEIDVIGFNASTAVQFWNLIKPAMEGDRDKKREISLRSEDKERVYEIAAFNLMQENGISEGHMITLRDITERKRMERLREDTERMIQHDLKNPLNAISGLTNLMLKDQSNVEHEAMLRQILKSSQDILLLINRSFDFFLMEQGRYIPGSNRIDLIPMFHRIVNNLEFLQHSGSVRVKIELPETCDSNSAEGCMICGEETYIESMFVNLIKNAIEASPSGEIVRISYEKRGEECEITIHNRGVIPKEIQNDFFEKYVTSGKKNGLGIGTHSAALIARAHGGNIFFRTSEIDGTYITVVMKNRAMDVPAISP